MTITPEEAAKLAAAATEGPLTMRLQRYPDGANEWSMFIWHRHPKWSRTWTHGVDLTKQRRESGQRRWGFFRIPGPQARYGITIAGYSLQLTTQAAQQRKEVR